jgi:hypothetical protein
LETLPRRIQDCEAENESRVIRGAVSQSWCDQERLHIYIYIDRGPGQVSITSSDMELYTDLAEVIQAAEKLKKNLWGKEIDVILTTTSDNTRKYVSKEWIKTLGLRYIGFNESNGLLIRPEYEIALGTQTFDYKWAMAKQFRGVVVTGIGAFSFPIIKQLPSKHKLGKTSFLYYLLFHLLSKRTPVAIELKSVRIPRLSR